MSWWLTELFSRDTKEKKRLWAKALANAQRMLRNQRQTGQRKEAEIRRLRNQTRHTHQRKGG